jgi:ATP-dependent RNA helicase SUPV3L1/SUV3
MAVVAVLGPTNTGKTYHAMERMLAHRTGMIGFPLRLLARENYDRLVKVKGEDQVALITGEERIVPRGAAYFVCTVEAMPVDRRVDFLAVDEVQLAADRERGHVFTDRVLHARGAQETMLLGAETVRPLLRALVPEAGFIARPRLSTLSYTAPRKLKHLPRRSAVVVFSLPDLYLVADRVRRETGGAALVFGALSPRTRNAQVGLYQAGEVDYLVATDAIGMGLNLDIDHVAFTGLVKFDGVGPRRLRAAEVAQIAGRAGRYVKDGTFGATGDLGPLDERLVDAVEQHRFEPLDTLYWRNPVLEFFSPHALLDSLERAPRVPELRRMKGADDHRALVQLMLDPEIMALARGADAVELLWEVCQVPDFRNVMTEAHTRLLGQVYRHLRGPARRLPEDWVASQVAAIDRLDGDLDALLARIAHIRTWTYVSHRPSWVADARHWQERTRAVEDRLSDALHERLTEQFVDRRAAVIGRVGTAGGELLLEITTHGDVLVQGVSAGRLDGFVFRADATDDTGLLRSAANKVLRAEIPERVRAFAEEPDEAFALSADGRVLWRGAPVGRLAAGESPLAPRVDALPSDLLDPPLRERVRRRIAAWVDGELRGRYAALFGEEREGFSPSARGLVFSLRAGLGAVPRREVARQIAALTPEDRRLLARRRISLGRLNVFSADLLRPDLMRQRALLFGLHRGVEVPAAPWGMPHLLADGLSTPLLVACGYHPAGSRAVRMDRAERLAAEARRASREGPFEVTPALAAALGATPLETRDVLAAMGFALDRDGRLRARGGQKRARSSTA